MPEIAFSQHIITFQNTLTEHHVCVCLCEVAAGPSLGGKKAKKKKKLNLSLKICDNKQHDKQIFHPLHSEDNVNSVQGEEKKNNTLGELILFFFLDHNV